jgi:hypothetical protein
VDYTGIVKNDDRVAVERECTREDMSALENILHGGVVHSASLGSNRSLRTVVMTLRWRHVNLPSCRTLFDEMTNPPTVVADAGHYNHHLWWWVQHGR